MSRSPAAMEHCWTHRPAPNRRSKWFTLCHLDSGAEKEPHLVVADLQNASLMLFNDEGHFCRDLIPPHAPWHPAAVAAGVQNTLAVCDWLSNAVCLNFFNHDLTFQRAELLGRANLTRPYSVAMTTVGNWVVADEDSLVLLDPFGGLIRRVHLPGQAHWQPRFVTTDAKQRIVVSAPSRGQVTLCDASGTPHKHFEGLGHPSGVLVNDLGQLLVCEQQRGAVSLFDARGDYLYDVISRERSLPRANDEALATQKWMPVAIATTTPGQVCLSASYGTDFVVQCFAYEFMPSSARSSKSSSLFTTFSSPRFG